MTLHDTLYRRTAAPTLNHQHGEAATLTPADGEPRVITARVNRAGLAENLDAGQVDTSRAAVLTVTIRRTDLPVLTLGGDRIAFAERRGGEVESFVLEQLINDAGDEWVVAVR